MHNTKRTTARNTIRNQAYNGKQSIKNPNHGTPHERFLFRIVGALVIGGIAGLVKLILLLIG